MSIFTNGLALTTQGVIKAQQEKLEEQRRQIDKLTKENNWTTLALQVEVGISKMLDDKLVVLERNAHNATHTINSQKQVLEAKQQRIDELKRDWLPAINGANERAETFRVRLEDANAANKRMEKSLREVKAALLSQAAENRQLHARVDDLKRANVKLAGELAAAKADPRPLYIVFPEAVRPPSLGETHYYSGLVSFKGYVHQADLKPAEGYERTANGCRYTGPHDGNTRYPDWDK